MRRAETASIQNPAEVCRGATRRRRDYVEAEQFTFPAYQEEFSFFTDLHTFCGNDLNAWRIWIWMLCLLAWEPKSVEFSRASEQVHQLGVQYGISRHQARQSQAWTAANDISELLYRHDASLGMPTSDTVRSVDAWLEVVARAYEAPRSLRGVDGWLDDQAYQLYDHIWSAFESKGGRA